MNKILSLLVVITLLACEKEKDGGSISNEIIGSWELAKTTGFAPHTTYPPGNGNIITIRKDGTYERKQNNTVVFTGSYKLRNKKDCHERNSNTIFSTNENNWESYQYIDVKADTLSLSTPNCLQDGSTSYFRRLQ